MTVIIIALVIIFIILIVMSGFITDATARMKRSPSDSSDMMAHKYGTIASVIGWVSVGIVLIICIFLFFNPELFLSPKFATLISILFGFVIIVVAICGILSAMAAAKMRAGASYHQNTKYYNYFIAGAVVCLVVVAMVIGTLIYMAIRHSKMKVQPTVTHVVTTPPHQTIHITTPPAKAIVKTSPQVELIPPKNLATLTTPTLSPEKIQSLVSNPDIQALIYNTAPPDIRGHANTILGVYNALPPELQQSVLKQAATLSIVQ